MRGEGAGILDLLIFAGVFACHFYKAAKGKQADLVVRVAILDAEQARAKADGEGLHADAAELGHGKVAELVDDHHDPDQNDKRSGGNKKVMHRRGARPQACTP